MVADDLVLLDERDVLVEPQREPLVQIGAGLLRQRLIGCVADQEVPESVGIVAEEHRLVRSDQLLAHETSELRVHRGADVVGSELGHGCSVEHLPLDGAALDHRPFVHRECVEPRLQQRVDRRGNDHLAAVLADHRDHLFDEQWVAARRLDDPRDQGFADALASERRDELGGLVPAERFQQPTSGGPRVARGARCRGGKEARRARGRRCARRDRETSAPPTGCRRTLR